jgi:dTDP-4-amino-4,6-dideoxygalactose transaminase
MYVPVYQGLTPIDFMRRPRPGSVCFPFDAPARRYFYRARNAIYHLFRVLGAERGPLTVLAPDYNSGNEILAMEAAGATIRYCQVDRRMRLDPIEVERLCDLHHPDVLYVIHYAGWAQDMDAMVDICRRRHMLLVEDCALALLSETNGRPLGSFGDWSVFCLYKTLPLPNGALLVQNTTRLDALESIPLRHAGAASVLGRTAELMVQRVRSRADAFGAALQMAKRAMGRAAGAMQVRRANVGDIGFNLDDVDLAMSPLSLRLLAGLDFEDIRRRRVENYRRLAAQIAGRATAVHAGLPDGVCPLFFPVIVPDKHAAAVALHARGVDALEFWNDSDDLPAHEMSSTEQFLRRHVLELPIHQDLSARHVDYVARQVAELDLRMHQIELVESVHAA